MQMVVIWAILAKAIMANNIHLNFRQDPLDQWIAIGVVYILIQNFLKEDK